MEEYKFWFSKRFLVGILAFFGEMNIFTLRGNINIAILEMTSSHNVTIGNTTITRDAKFNWSEETKGFILGLYAYGSILAPLGGYVAIRFGGSTIIGISSLSISILTILNPIILRYSFNLFVICRLIEGVTECFRFVSFPELWTQWSPIRDRSKLMAITLSGLYAAPAIVYPIFGYLTQTYGWPSTFYYSGTFSLLWSVIWLCLVPNRPESDKWISKRELEYIRQDPPRLKPKDLKSMWKNMITSKPVYALGIARIVQDFGLAVTVTCLPMYMKDLTGSKINKIGVYSAIPTVVNILTVPCAGYLIDFLRNKQYLTISQALKLFACSAFTFGGIILLTIPHWSSNFIILMVCFALFKTTVSTIFITTNLDVINLAPGCSSALASFMAWFHMLGSVIAPLIITTIVTDHALWQWNICFYIFAVISFFASITFYYFGSGEPQPWSYSTKYTTSTGDRIEESEMLTQPFSNAQ